MKIRNLLLILALTIALLSLSGCLGVEQKVVAPEQNQKPLDYGKPYSNGPTDQTTIKGPSAPPPENTQSTAESQPQAEAQAVTTSENIRLTLPLKTGN
jgi:hypothetical protein